MPPPNRLIVVSGLSGSGKTVALHVLEDLGFYCIDNLPVALLGSMLDEIHRHGDNSETRIAVGVDARNRVADIEKLPETLTNLRNSGTQTDLLFLQAADEILLKRYRETRRRHPLSKAGTELRAAIASERELLGPIINAADQQAAFTRMYDDILRFLQRWIPEYLTFNRGYLTVAIGCTGGQHRSVYMTEKLAKALQQSHEPVYTRHSELTRHLTSTT